MKFSDIKKFPSVRYNIDVAWDYLETHINRYIKEYGLQMNPDFQRGHVWTKEQQISFVEYMLKQPQVGSCIYINHPNWMDSFEGDMVLVDGLQRLTAALSYLKNEIPAYGVYLKDMEGHGLRSIFFQFKIASIKTKKEVLEWYIDFNAGGTPHSKEEIEKVKLLLKETTIE